MTLCDVSDGGTTIELFARVSLSSSSSTSTSSIFPSSISSSSNPLILLLLPLSSSPPSIVSSSADDSSVSGGNVFVVVGVLAQEPVEEASEVIESSALGLRRDSPMPEEEVEREERSAVADEGRTMSPTFSMLD